MHCLGVFIVVLQCLITTMFTMIIVCSIKSMCEQVSVRLVYSRVYTADSNPDKILSAFTRTSLIRDYM